MGCASRKGVTIPERTVLRGFDITFHLGLKLVVNPIPELANFKSGGSGRVKFGHALPCRHSVLMVGAAHNRRLGNQAKRRKSGLRLVDARRTRRALGEDKSKGLFEPMRACTVGKQPRRSVAVGRQGIRQRSETRMTALMCGLSTPGVSITTSS